MASQAPLKYARWSIMEWLLAGGLPRSPRQAVSPGDTEPADARKLERTAARLEKEQRRREQERVEAERRAALDRSRASSTAAREALRAQEAELRQRQPELKRELAGEEAEEATPASFAERLRQGVSKTRDRLSGGLTRLVMGRKELDRELLDDLEELLLTADVGVTTTQRLIGAVEERVKRNELKDPERLKTALREEVERVMDRDYAPLHLDGKPPQVVLFAGVNGTGKTTTIGKLAYQYAQEGRKVLLAAGDTFRAAAAEQLAGWAQRASCDIYFKEAGANPSGLVYEAVEKAAREGYDLVLCDTAGRLHTKSNLMEELKKIKRVMAKVVPEAPHETFLVLDANNGQNAIHQARDFNDAIELTGLIVTKLDGTARGGVIVGIVNEFDLPVRYIGVGERVDDLRPFDPRDFAASLFD